MKPSLQQRIEAANTKGNMAYIPFITAGYPAQNDFLQALRDLDENGADIIEIGIPFSDPVADGPVVESASRRMLETGVNLPAILEQLAALPFTLKAGLVLMGYYNPFFQYGLEQFAIDAAHAGVQGVIIPDLPLGEDEQMRHALSAQGIDLIALIGPNTPQERMEEYAKQARGYVYVVSVMGVTGVRNGLPPEVVNTLRLAKTTFDIPVALGFGIQHPAQIAELDIRPDAVVFGSALLKFLEEGKSAKLFMEPWLSIRMTSAESAN